MSFVFVRLCFLLSGQLAGKFGGVGGEAVCLSLFPFQPLVVLLPVLCLACSLASPFGSKKRRSHLAIQLVGEIIRKGGRRN